MFQIEDAGEGDQAMAPSMQQQASKIPPKHDPINPLNAIVANNNAEDVFPEYTNKHAVTSDDKMFSLRPEPIAENTLQTPH